MSVITYTTEADHPGADSVKPVAVNHAADCTVGKQGWPDTTRTTPDAACSSKCKTGYSVETHRGRVIADRERNGADDSDFYAVIGDPATGKTTTEVYATTRGWTYFNGCTVDAPPALVEKCAAVKREFDAARKAAAKAEEAAIRATMPTAGTTVRVKSKRSKVPHGTIGRVVFFNVSEYAHDFDRHRNPHGAAFDMLPADVRRFSSRPGDFRVGLETTAGAKFYCSAACVEVVAA